MKRLAIPALLLALAAGLTGCGGGVKPAPQPVPVPVPVPPAPEPPPRPAPAGVVVVEDTAAAGQARGLFLADRKVAAFFKNSDLDHAVLSTATVGPDGRVPAAARKYLDAAAGKPLPYLFVVDRAGRVLKDRPLPLDPDEFVALFDAHPGPRALGCNIAPPRLKWEEFGTAAAPTTKLVPRDQWREVSLEAYLPPVYDQDGRGQCNASATCTAIELAREVAGMAPVKLSAGDLYSQINGGGDRGSLLEDGLDASLKAGVATARTVPYVWDGRRHDRRPEVQAERKNHRVVEAYLCPTFDHCASAVQQGFAIVEGVWWYDNFKPDRDGWLPRQGRGNRGGHALCGYGLARRDGVWGIRTRNSWGTTWGVGGDCVIPEDHFGREIGGYWAVRSVVRTPEPFPPAEPLKARRATVSPADLLQLAP